jgi:hypothetical protein
MPPQNGVGLNYVGQSDQAWPQLCQPDQHRPIATRQPETARRLPQGNIELMPKKQVFDFKLAPRLEQISGKGREQTEDRKHHVE